jgi:hypothetical protein
MIPEADECKAWKMAGPVILIGVLRVFFFFAFSR